MTCIRSDHAIILRGHHFICSLPPGISSRLMVRCDQDLRQQQSAARSCKYRDATKSQPESIFVLAITSATINITHVRLRVTISKVSNHEKETPCFSRCITSLEPLISHGTHDQMSYQALRRASVPCPTAIVPYRKPPDLHDRRRLLLLWVSYSTSSER